MRERLRALWFMTALAFRADPWRAAGALAMSAVSAASQPLLAYTLSRVIAAVISGDGHRAVVLAVALGGLGAVTLGAGLVRLDLRFRMEETTSMLIDAELIALTAGIPGLEHHERPEHLDRLDLVRTQRRQLSGSVGALVENFGTVASMATTTALLASVDLRLLLLPLFGIPSIAASAYTRRRYQQIQEDTAERNRLAMHLFTLATTGAPAKELRVFGLRRELRRRFTGLVDDVNAEYDRAALRTMAVTTGGWMVFAAAYVAALALIAQSAVAGRADAADVVLVVSMAAQVNQQVNSVFWMVGWLLDTLKTVSRYLRVADDAAAAATPAADPVDPPARLARGIDLVDVGFRYPGTEADVLHQVQLHLPAGSTVAVVGDNGAGKSTLVKLLCGFYSPTSGAVLVDGVDLRRIPAGAWRARMSAGFQDFAKLELLARETVGVGDLPLIDDAAAVGAALDRASAADVVQAMAAGLETQVGRSFDSGVELSGGQWQKLALGRAMMRGAPLLLVLDEPTAALDADTEHALFERYAGAARTVAADTGGITLLVSHRFSTVRMADLIVVVGGGTVTECGSHQQLMAKGGVYAELYELQARAYR
ncbi:MAG TPA: ABC transporter ATP-binding protein [Acidimicrobiales bacterium]|nr:ABC transporter ATP-binding protein [Acidimicrobiales bacterium]